MMRQERERIGARDRLTSAYIDVSAHLYERGVEVEDEDVLHRAVTALLARIDENATTKRGTHYRDMSVVDFSRYLRRVIRARRYDTQQAVPVVALGDSEGGQDAEPALAYVPGDQDLLRWIIHQRLPGGRRMWSTRQLRVLVSKALLGMSHVEIAQAMSISTDAVDRVARAIDRKMFKLPIREMVSRWGYRGSGLRSAGDAWAPRYDTTPGKAVYNDSPIPDPAPEDLPDYRPRWHESSMSRREGVSNPVPSGYPFPSPVWARMAETPRRANGDNW